MPLLNPETLAEAAASVAPRLPPYPRVVAQLFNLLDDDNASLEGIALAARHDAVIAAGILSLANHLRQRHEQPPLGDPFVATSIIGISQVKRVVTLAAMNKFAVDDQEALFLLNHSRAVAIVAQELATLAGIAPDLAPMAGMLLDIGQLAFLTLDRSRYVALHRQGEDDESLIARERESFGVTHTEMGASLARHWLLPEALVHAIDRHHDALLADDKLQAVLCLAESLARALDLPPSPRHRLTHLNRHAQHLLGIDWASPQVHDLLGRCRSRYRHAAA